LRWRYLLIAALLFLPGVRSARAQEDDDTPALKRYLISLQLGDDLEQVKRVYPPAADWPPSENKNGVTRYRVDRGSAKSYPAQVETFYLGVKKGRLVEIEVVYDEKTSRRKPVETIAGDYALVYGESRRSGDRFWWSDGRTVLRVFPAEVPYAKDGATAVAWRTAVQVFDQGLFDKGE
jgi:hypothetical protein